MARPATNKLRFHSIFFVVSPSNGGTSKTLLKSIHFVTSLVMFPTLVASDDEITPSAPSASSTPGFTAGFTPPVLTALRFPDVSESNLITRNVTKARFLIFSSFVHFNKMESMGRRSGVEGEVSSSFLYHNFSVCKIVSVRLSRLGRLIEGQSFAFACRVRRIFWSLSYPLLTIWFDLFEKQICKYERFSHSVSPEEKKSPWHQTLSPTR